MDPSLGLSNATRAQITAAVRAAVVIAAGFGLGLSGEQVTALVVLIETLAVAWMALAYKLSPKRVPDSEDIKECMVMGCRLPVAGTPAMVLEGKAGPARFSQAVYFCSAHTLEWYRASTETTP